LIEISGWKQKKKQNIKVRREGRKEGKNKERKKDKNFKKKTNAEKKKLENEVFVLPSQSRLGEWPRPRETPKERHTIPKRRKSQTNNKNKREGRKEERSEREEDRLSFLTNNFLSLGLSFC
jgi:hypothetical protein